MNSNVKLKSVSTSFIIFFILCFISCNGLEYSPNGSHNVEIEPVDLDSSIKLSPEIDTLETWGRTEILYDIDLQGKRLKRVECYLDSMRVAASTSTVRLYFNASDFPDGLYQMKLVAEIQTGSGSLADQFGEEVVNVENIWPLYIDSRPPTVPAKILSVKPDSGSLRLDWSLYPNRNLGSYKIYRLNSGTFDHTLLAEVKQRKITSWYDSLYIGGEIVYRVDISAAGEVKQGEIISVNYQKTGIVSIKERTSTSLEIKWRKCLFPANLKSYTLQRGPAGALGYTYINIATMENATDTSFVDRTVGLGRDAQYRIELRSANGYLISEPQYGQIGISCPTFYEIKYLSMADYIVGYGGLNSFVMEPEGYQILAERGDGLRGDGLMNINPITEKTFIEIYPKLLIEVDPATLRNTSTPKTLYDYEEDEKLYFDKFYVTTDNLIITRADHSSKNYTQQYLIVFDPNAKNPKNSIIAKIDLAYNRAATRSYYKIVNVASTGKYLTLDNEYLYSFHNFKLEQLYEVDDPKYFTFTPDGLQFISTNQNTIAIKNCENGQIIRQFPIDDNLIRIALDPYTGYLGGQSESDLNFRVYNLENGKLLREVPLSPHANKLEYRKIYYLVRSTLFCGEGYYLPLENLGETVTEL